MRVVALTGAGISAESGVPTFRDAAGLWRDHKPEELAAPEAFARDPLLVWEFYAWRREIVSAAEPNEAHELLAGMEASGRDLTIITQNVDGLHQRAGSQNVIELHGSLWKLKCTRAPHEWNSTVTPFPELPPVCPRCGGLARPDVVWFGETLDPQILKAAYEMVRKADRLLVIGTSGLVYPAADLPRVAKNAQAQIIEINPQRTPLSSMADTVYRRSAAEGLKMWLDQG